MIVIATEKLLAHHGCQAHCEQRCSLLGTRVRQNAPYVFICSLFIPFPGTLQAELWALASEIRNVKGSKGKSPQPNGSCAILCHVSARHHCICFSPNSILATPSPCDRRATAIRETSMPYSNALGQESKPGDTVQPVNCHCPGPKTMPLWPEFKIVQSTISASQAHLSPRDSLTASSSVGPRAPGPQACPCRRRSPSALKS